MSAAKAAITSLGREIQYGLLSDNVAPMIFTFSGAGNVSQVRARVLQSGIQLEFVQGAQEVFQELPHEFVSPTDLKEVNERGGRLMYATEYVATLCP